MTHTTKPRSRIPPMIRLTLMTAQSRLAIIACVVYGIWEGVGIVHGGAARWTSPTYEALLQIPGGLTTWAAWVMGGAVVTAVGVVTKTWLLRAIGLASMSVWSASFGIGARIAAYNNATAGTTAGPTYLLLAFLIAILIGYQEPECHTDS